MSEEEIIPEAVPVASDPPASELSTNQVSQLQNLTKHNVAQFISNAEALVEFYIAIRKIALKATSVHDWELLGENPWLKDPGINKVLQLIGASIKNVEMFTDTEHEDGLGRVDHYTAKGQLVFNGKVFENIGMSSTKDPFFAKRKDVFLKWDEVDRANCKKKSVTNLKHRLLMMAFEFNPTADELKEHFGDKFGNIGKTTYAKGNQGGSTDTKDIKNLRNELGNEILRVAGGDVEKSQVLLKELTTWTNDEGKEIAGHSDLQRLKSDKQIHFMIKKVKEMNPPEREAGQD